MSAKPTKRIIAKLDIKNGQLVKGINLEGLRILGDPYEFTKLYSTYGIDEIFYQDNVAALYGTNNLSIHIKNTSKDIRVPLSVGGGIRSIKDIENVLLSGADKVCINSAVINDAKFLKSAVKEFGSANISVLIESIKIKNKYYISYLNGRELVQIDPITWSKKIEDEGAGEVVLTSVNNEGLMNGFDNNLSNRIQKEIKIPVIVHGGAGSFKDIYKVLKLKNIHGVMIAGMFHYHYLNFTSLNCKKKIGNTEFLKNFKKKKVKKNYIFKLKKYLKEKNINVRL
tara:strand:- start:4015 stop:4863 length:849 start_codon:yes stop_codon:yes gene_type:complete